MSTRLGSTARVRLLAAPIAGRRSGAEMVGPIWLLDRPPPALEEAGRHIVVAIIHPCLTCLVSP